MPVAPLLIWGDLVKILKDRGSLWTREGFRATVPGIYEEAHLRNLRHMHNPLVQRKIMAVLWMAPIYGATALMSLVLDSPTASEYLAVIKDFYEAYCIYTFLSLLIAILGRGDRDEAVDVLAARADHMKPPIYLCGWSPFLNLRKYESNPRGKADAILYQCQFCAMQFVLFRPITLLLVLGRFARSASSCCIIGDAGCDLLGHPVAED